MNTGFIMSISICDNRQAVWTLYYQQYFDPLVGYLYSRTGSWDVAHDIAQDAFEKIFGQCDLTEIRDLKAYLYSTGVNLAINYVKREKRLFERANEQESIDYFAFSRKAANGLDPDENIEFSDMVNGINDTLGDLPHKCKKAFLLHKLLGYSHRESAEQLNVSQSTIEKYIMRAKTTCANHRAAMAS